jgi:N-acetylmuramoyl-L-alanine amidase
MLSDPNRAAHELGLRGEASSDIMHMLVDVNQQAVLKRSEDLAESILQRLSRLLPTRAVKQKSFAVLRNIRLPSVLIECGFLSNRRDAALIKDSGGRDRIANGIAGGIRRYLEANPLPREQGRPVLVHRVQAGDTLWKLSREYGASIASIRQLNRLDSSMLRVGQELLIYGRY